MNWSERGFSSMTAAAMLLVAMLSLAYEGSASANSAPGLGSIGCRVQHRASA